MANVREPIETTLTPMIECFASSPQTSELFPIQAFKAGPE